MIKITSLLLFTTCFLCPADIEEGIAAQYAGDKGIEILP